MQRRDVLKAGVAIGFGVRLAPAMAAAQDDRASAKPQEGDVLVKAGDAGRTPLGPDDVPRGAMQMMAWAMDPAERVVRDGTRFNQIMLLRLDPDRLSAETRSRAADGVVAYTMICTHSGCDVDDWAADQQLITCSCHDSIFDPKDGARVVDGPAPRPLPALPLKIVDGKLVVAGPFTSRVGFEPG